MDLLARFGTFHLCVCVYIYVFWKGLCFYIGEYTFMLCISEGDKISVTEGEHCGHLWECKVLGSERVVSLTACVCECLYTFLKFSSLSLWCPSFDPEFLEESLNPCVHIWMFFPVLYGRSAIIVLCIQIDRSVSISIVVIAQIDSYTRYQRSTLH